MNSAEARTLLTQNFKKQNIEFDEYLQPMYTSWRILPKTENIDFKLINRIGFYKDGFFGFGKTRFGFIEDEIAINNSDYNKIKILIKADKYYCCGKKYERQYIFNVITGNYKWLAKKIKRIQEIGMKNTAAWLD